MSELTLTDPSGGPVLGESRGRVLDLLRTAGEAVGVQDIAERAGLHPNTARFHLDGLVDADLAEREAEERSQPGRPRMVYRAVATGMPAGRRSYRLLAEMLTSLVADALPQPDQAAARAGEAWGRYLAERPAPSQRIDIEEGVRRLSTVLADAGFAPDAVNDLAKPVIRLRHCPFREVAAQHGEVVCSLHLGLMRGVLAEVRAPLKVDRLEPFVEPTLCVAHLMPVARRPTGVDGAPTTKGRRRTASPR
ncbi:helix-turn-helix domain-containing protein [Pseudonocardia sp. 73-21]|uniref:helix-turn-helix transcriptional regulator n=1 Tax=Pseudonocardia sp. 73-21 TaxID=1895809 RepID=UPI0009593676|nr:helix-turn-helix domain-containing protein [Pseudonocardia sp. 73-21]OJY53257.1 MAG: ArsR family transcriptional regulator [Pseudonocardia sp. 73-21]